MIVLTMIGLAAFLLACTVVGVRLLLHWRRSRELPELAIGLAFLLGGALGYVPVVVTSVVVSLPTQLSTAVFAAGILALNVGAGALWVFTWQVFRPGDPWARLLFFAAITLLFGSFVGQAATGGLSAATHVHSGWYWAGFLARAGAFGWGAVESFVHYIALRKRARLGLAAWPDANVFLLWGVATSAAFLIFAMTALGVAASESQLPAPIVFGQSFAGLTSAGAIWLTFFPPARYTQYLRRRAEPQDGSEDA